MQGECRLDGKAFVQKVRSPDEGGNIKCITEEEKISFSNSRDKTIRMNFGEEHFFEEFQCGQIGQNLVIWMKFLHWAIFGIVG